MSTKKLLAVYCVTAAMTTGTLKAADAGDPVFPIDLNNKARAELLYENRQRDLDNDLRLKADVFALRIHTDVGQYANLDFDIGMISPAGGSDEFYGGIGLRFLAYDSEYWRLSPYAQVHYAPRFRMGGVSYDDLIDADAGLLLACKLKLDQQLTLMPYAGPVLSIVRIGGNDDPREDRVLGGVAGVSLLMPGNNTIRIEAQYFDRVSVSAAAGIAF
ncbi:MAG TPA: hypothetical protein PJ991_02275 [Kiritimatiellia bacterium]|nr:hypothetical protein [Kiritimatiellia bacterium]